jgi:hypothetical protein
MAKPKPTQHPKVEILNTQTMKPVMTRLLITTLCVAASACTPRYRQDGQFQDWFLRAQTNCTLRYGALPTGSKDESAQLMELTYRAYRGELSREAFASQLQSRYPANGPGIDCLASSLPR